MILEHGCTSLLLGTFTRCRPRGSTTAPCGRTNHCGISRSSVGFVDGAEASSNEISLGYAATQEVAPTASLTEARACSTQCVCFAHHINWICRCVASRNLKGTATGCGSIPRQVLFDLGDQVARCCHVTTTLKWRS